MQLADIGRAQPLLLGGLGAGIARQARSNGKNGEAGDGGAGPCEWPLPPGPSRWWRGFAAGERKVCAVFAQGLVIDHAGTLACAEARRRVQRDILLCTSLYFFVLLCTQGNSLGPQLKPECSHAEA